MNADFKEVEIIFAQKLASGEPITRRRAFRTLRDWILTESAKREFGEETMLHLSKGLHYVMWMQDKMLWQEKLADNIASLLNLFGRETESVLFVKSMLITLSNEWSRIDRWRMDKFLMLMRRLIRTLFIRLRWKGWKKSVTDMYISAFKECVISSDKNFSEGLKFHFASIYLDELDYAGSLRPDQLTEMLKPYAELLADANVGNYLFDSVLQEIFVTILHQYAEEKAERNKPVRLGEGSASDQGIKFDYGQISKLLFGIGKKTNVKGVRRRKLYSVAKKFKVAEIGGDPFKMVTKSEICVKAKLPKVEIMNAVSRLLKEEAENRALKKKVRLKKKASGRLSNEVVEVKTSNRFRSRKIVKKSSKRKGIRRMRKQF